MLRFDKDKNGTIDWFEADAYRRSLDKPTHPKITTLTGAPVTGGATGSPGRPLSWSELTKKHDKDGDGKLTGEERKAAYIEYKQSRSRSSASSGSKSTKQIWADLTTKHDLNRDGKLSGSERTEAYREYKQIRGKSSSHTSKHSKHRK